MAEYTIDLSQYTMQEVNNMYLERIINHAEYMEYLENKKQDILNNTYHSKRG